jgi:hypothetical protein
MSDWAPGDLALCIKGGTLTVAGCVYTVSEVVIPGKRYINPESGRGIRWAELCLRFTEIATSPYATACAAKRFVKVTPLTEDEFDREVIELYLTPKVGEPA